MFPGRWKIGGFEQFNRAPCSGMEINWQVFILFPYVKSSYESGLYWRVVVILLKPTGENGATRAPISVDLQRDGSLSSKSIILQIDNKSQQVSASEISYNPDEHFYLCTLRGFLSSFSTII